MMFSLKKSTLILAAAFTTATALCGCDDDAPPQEQQRAIADTPGSSTENDNVPNGDRLYQRDQDARKLVESVTGREASLDSYDPTPGGESCYTVMPPPGKSQIETVCVKRTSSGSMSVSNK